MDRQTKNAITQEFIAGNYEIHELSIDEREYLIRKHLPKGRDDEYYINRGLENEANHRTDYNHNDDGKDGKRKVNRKPIRTLIKWSIFRMMWFLLHFIIDIVSVFKFILKSIFTKVMNGVYDRNCTPERIKKDVEGLKKMPKHLSILLELDGDHEDVESLTRLMEDVCKCATWSTCAGIEKLSIYEKTGILKSLIPDLHQRITNSISECYDKPLSSSSSDSSLYSNIIKPSLSIRAPHQQTFSPPLSPPLSPTSSRSTSPSPPSLISNPPHLSILLISESDGKKTIVDLTRTLTNMSQTQKIKPDDISIEIIDAEIKESVMSEPDLLIVFSARSGSRNSSREASTNAGLLNKFKSIYMNRKGRLWWWEEEPLVLKGFPPWSIRLTEILHVPDRQRVNYRMFLRGLRIYAGAEMRFGS